MNRMMSLVLAGAVIALTVACSAPQPPRNLEDLKELDGFLKVLERGEIASVDEPLFVPAAEADIADAAWVIGVHSGGTAKAYSINLLNEHEVVNDDLDGAPIATTW
jgi:hypothetical protein